MSLWPWNSLILSKLLLKTGAFNVFAGMTTWGNRGVWERIQVKYRTWEETDLPLSTALKVYEMGKSIRDNWLYLKLFCCSSKLVSSCERVGTSVDISVWRHYCSFSWKRISLEREFRKRESAPLTCKKTITHTGVNLVSNLIKHRYKYQWHPHSLGHWSR